MAQATCRCGQLLEVRGEGLVRVVCPGCGMRVRVRVRADEDAPSTVPAPGMGSRSTSEPNEGEGAELGGQVADPYIRFYCSCGRRLKVLAADYHPQGKCPECGRIVAVPPPAVPAYASPGGGESRGGKLAAGDPETETADLDPADLEIHRRWCRDHMPAAAEGEGLEPRPSGSSSGGMRVSISKGIAQHREAGLRICSACGAAYHMNSPRCTKCGAGPAAR